MYSFGCIEEDFSKHFIAMRFFFSASSVLLRPLRRLGFPVEKNFQADARFFG
jgi:hypothetical protein